MTKKRSYRFLTILLSFMFLFFVGCDGGPAGDGDDDGNTPKSLDSVKVISRPVDYKFEDAVAGKSQYYYNLFAKEIVYDLYNVYHNAGEVFVGDAANKREALFNGFDTANGLTYNTTNSFGNNVTDKYYVFDGLRYNLESITTTKDADGNVTAQTLVFNTDSAWAWTIDNDATGFVNVFKTANLITSNNATSFIVNFDFENRFAGYTDWKEVASTMFTFPTYQDFYAQTANAGEGKTMYSDSPYYQGVLGGTGAKNYFQDAMEYAVYLFVMGYDYVDSNGNATEDAPYFDFEITKTNGVVSGINVTWNGQKISITEALGKAKELYNRIGGYVGITSQNQEQIKRFIKDKIIGEKAYNDFNAYEITCIDKLNGVDQTPTKIKINKNYDKFIDNLLTLACNEAPIGFAADGSLLSLSDAYLASQITDYKGDYFFLSYENESDDNLFQYIPAQEYQALILNPQAEDIGSILGDIWIAFEYFEAPEGTQDLPFGEEIVINVGLRYFSCSANGGAGGYIYNDQIQKTVKYGHSDSFDKPDENWVYIGYTSSSAGYYDLTINDPIKLETQFNNDIGDGAIKAGEGETATKLIDGRADNNARDYFMLNQSETYGTYGTLNPDMFSQNAAGEDACDYFEIYFDIVKEKGKLQNYNFKVGLVYYGMAEDVY